MQPVTLKGRPLEAHTKKYFMTVKYAGIKYSSNPSYSLLVLVSQYPVFSFLFSESSVASLADWQG